MPMDGDPVPDGGVGVPELADQAGAAVRDGNGPDAAVQQPPPPPLAPDANGHPAELPPEAAPPENGQVLVKRTPTITSVGMRSLFDANVLDAMNSTPKTGDAEKPATVPQPAEPHRASLRSRILAAVQPLLFLLAGPLISLWSIALARGAEAAGNAFMDFVTTGYNRFLGLIITPCVFGGVAFITAEYAKGSHASGIPQCMLALVNLDKLDARQRAHLVLVEAELEEPNELDEAVVIPPRARTWGDWFSGRPLLEKLVSPRILLWKFVGTIAIIGGGGVAGREGPTAQIAASVSHIVATVGGFSALAHRSAIMSGTAAGIAAAFTTPIGGITFSIEELGKVYNDVDKAIIPITVTLSGLVAKAFDSDGLYYGRVYQSYNNGAAGLYPDLFFTLIFFSCLAGFLGGAWARLTLTVTRFFAISDTRLAQFQRRRPYAIAFLCGLAIALLGLIPGQYAYGPGYVFAREILQTAANATTAVPDPFQALPPNLIWSLFPLKFVGCFLTFISTAPSGIFAPSMAAGIGLGALFATLACRYFLPTWPANLALPVVICTGNAYFSGVTQSPLTASVILLESMSLDGTWILPVLLSGMVGMASAKYTISPDPVYDKLKEIALEAQRKARSAAGADAETAADAKKQEGHVD
ncbi:chloride channel [Hyaloraphidium curvatum]|nr:chloride channel [Hyaloraphidium curvatum]